MSLTEIFLDSLQLFRKVCKKLDFSPKQYFAVFLFKVSAWLFNHAVCKIGLMEYSVAGGKLIREKNQKQKISWHCPFNAKHFLYNNVLTSRWLLNKIIPFPLLASSGYIFSYPHKRRNLIIVIRNVPILLAHCFTGKNII